MRCTEAVAILIRNAAANVVGPGTGVRPEHNPLEVARVRQAVRVVWRLVYDFPPDESALRNLGL